MRLYWRRGGAVLVCAVKGTCRQICEQNDCVDPLHLERRMLLGSRIYINIRHELAHNAIDVFISKRKYMQAHRQAWKQFGNESIQIISNLIYRLDGEPLLGHMTVEYLLAFEKARELAREKYRAYKSEKARVEASYKGSRKAKTAMRSLLKCIWFERIRFASRAIGNECDYSLLMVATPPTMASVDEYDAFVLNVHQRGGALVGSLA